MYNGMYDQTYQSIIEITKLSLVHPSSIYTWTLYMHNLNIALHYPLINNTYKHTNKAE